MLANWNERLSHLRSFSFAHAHLHVSVRKMVYFIWSPRLINFIEYLVMENLCEMVEIVNKPHILGWIPSVEYWVSQGNDRTTKVDSLDANSPVKALDAAHVRTANMAKLSKCIKELPWNNAFCKIRKLMETVNELSVSKLISRSWVQWSKGKVIMIASSYLLTGVRKAH